MSSKGYIYTIIAILYISILQLHAEAFPRHSGAATSISAADSTSGTKNKVVRIHPSTGNNALRDTTIAPTGILSNDSIIQDALSMSVDTTAIDTTTHTTEQLKTKSALDAVVDFTAQDSLVFDAGNMAFLYGKSVVNYQDIQLDAEHIELSLENNTVYAVGRTDSLGQTTGKPIYKDASGEYESETMSYNFKSKRGYITNVITEQGEGYLTGGRTKKTEDDVLYMENGRYTTCDNHEHPHFYLQLTKAKVRPQKDVVAGPAYMVLEDVPLPLAVPFGFFPFNKKYSSGIIFPTFGEELNRGFYIRNGGYYFAINDYVDLALTGEIYTKGSWGVQARSAYIKKYKFSGSVDISFINTVTGDKGMPDYSSQENFKVAWTHTQDAKASSNSSFSASVNFATSGYTRNDINSYYDPNQFTQSTSTSTINYTYRIPNAPVSISAT
ncbi:MAG: LPS-assembly protein LptD, partial [Bacteroidaceae bacterium]|nr:LPS-assembly protein LptD [Bacteroidaceae bacterium]